MKRKLPAIGPRTVKTALAVTLAVLLIRQFTADSLSVFYAAFGALVAMDTTFSRSLRQGLTQLIGVLAGTLVGYLAVLLFPAGAPVWVAGLGVLLLICLCNFCGLTFSASLSCMIFLSVCLDSTDNILRDSLFRLRDTSVGVGVALAVNGLIRPYNNRKRILTLLLRLQERLPQELEQAVVYERYPDLHESVSLLRRIDQELALYHSQRFFHRRHDDEAPLRGCYRLAERMIQELEVICGMDTLGDVSAENAEKMRSLGLSLPQEDGQSRKCHVMDTVVMNFHIEKLLCAYEYLAELIGEITASDSLKA